MSRIAIGVAAAWVLVLAPLSASGSTELPSSEKLPANVVAVVSHVPVSLGRITKAELQRALVQGAAAAGREAPPQPGADGYEKLKNKALEERLNTVWIEGQAAMMGIDVTPRQVARELAQIKKQNFKDEAEYRRFLRQAHFTQGDVNERVRLQLLSTRIEERIGRQAKGPSDVQEVFKEFVNAYLKRWRARTVCASGYVIDSCSNGPLPHEP